MPYLVTPLYTEAPLENPLLFLIPTSKDAIQTNKKFKLNKYIKDATNSKKKIMVQKVVKGYIPSQIGYKFLPCHALHLF